MSDQLDTLRQAADASAARYDEALAGGADEATLTALRDAHGEDQVQLEHEEWKQAQRDAFGDHLEFEGWAVTNIGVEATVHDDTAGG